MSELSAREKRDWLRLSRTSRVGPVTFAQLVARFGSASAALDALPDLARRGGGGAPFIPSAIKADEEIAALAKRGGRMIASCEVDFPPALAAMDSPPPVVSVLGNAAILMRDMVAIVGARNASVLGRKLAAQIAQGLGQAGFVVVSGLARGIDTAAHESALPTGTIGVVAGGVDTIYPPENAPLFERMIAEGAIVSEMPLGEEPRAKHFPRRNRIISGLSRGVVVVEAAQGSGSLITAEYAAAQGREVFAVPGSPMDPRARGTNRLLRDGAVLTESAQDVIAVLRPLLRHLSEPDAPAPRAPPASIDIDAEAGRIRDAVIEALSPAPLAVDMLIRHLGAPAAAVHVVLLEMDLAGRIARHPGNQVSLA